MRRVRFTVRGLMVAVAVLAVVLAGGITGRRWTFYRERAEYYRRQEASWHIEAGGSYRNAADEYREGKLANADRSYDEALRESEMGWHYGKLRLKYDRAARYPWLPVEPDPPEPR